MQGNLSFLPDFYHLLMSQGFYKNGTYQKRVAFEVFFRKAFQGSYTIFCGLDPLIKHLEGDFFTPLILDHLKNLGQFDDDFLNYLKDFRFKGNLISVKEGEVVFPFQTLVRIEASLIEAHIVESLILNYINYQSLIATKAARLSNILKEKTFVDFGLRRAYGPDGAYSATRAAFIGGSSGSSNVIAGAHLNIPLIGSMSHSWVMSFESEKEAFLSFGRLYPSNAIFLVDTYDTLEQGVPHAIEAFKALEKEGVFDKKVVKAIRIDSGDLDELSHKSREMLDQNGLTDIKILVSNEINEEILESLLLSNSPIDFYGIGTRLVTGDEGGSLGAIYKLVAMEEENQWKPKIKISENKYKMTIPGLKNFIRFYNKDKKAMADLIILESEKEAILEQIKNKKPIKLYDPIDMITVSYIKNYHDTEILLSSILVEGKNQKGSPSLKEVKIYKEKRLASFQDSYKRRINPPLYQVGLSPQVAKLREEMILESKHF